MSDMTRILIAIGEGDSKAAQEPCDQTNPTNVAIAASHSGELRQAPSISPPGPSLCCAPDSRALPCIASGRRRFRI